MSRGREKCIQDGLFLDQLFGNGNGYTFDDVLILPPFSEVSADQISIAVNLTANIKLNLPIISSPMDTVTEWKTAVYMALMGALGIIHFNLSPDEAVAQVERVKRFRMGFIYEPICRKPDDPCSEVMRVKEKHGFSTLLITEDGTGHSRLLGMVMKGNVELIDDSRTPLKEVMIPIEQLTIRTKGQVKDLTAARKVLLTCPSASKLPVVNDDGSIFALVTRKGVAKSTQYPKALLGKNEQLVVGAAVSTYEEDRERVRRLLDAGTDIITIDSAQGGTLFAVKMIKYIRRQSDEVAIIAGNVVTAAQAEPLIEAGADALRVGMGSGSICTTQDKIGLGSSQLAAVYNVARLVARGKNACAVISDGGIKKTSDMIKAYACGADVVMVGGYIAGCAETPAEESSDEEGKIRKRYRGMGSMAAIAAGGKKRYGHERETLGKVVTQGVERWVPFLGPLEDRLADTALHIVKALEYFGCITIARLHKRVKAGEIQFQVRSSAAREEGRHTQ